VTVVGEAVCWGDVGAIVGRKYGKRGSLERLVVVDIVRFGQRDKVERLLERKERK
jgi:hypothetical protein